MIILHDGYDQDKIKGHHIVIIFGVGLIGKHLAQSLLRSFYVIAKNLTFSWGEGKDRTNEKIAIIHSIDQLVENGRHHSEADFSCRIDFVWSAGKGGFFMREIEARSELSSFLDVLAITDHVCASYPKYLVRFHMLSSAGGLFEGQRNVKLNSIPCVKRPYGAMKLEQEHLLTSKNTMIQFIYRPSSVYGFAGLSHRLGLIPTLLWNGLNNKLSSIFGTPDTLRDFVWAQDIGEFISNIILSQITISNCFILASGKPSSLFEILKRVENILNKKIYYHFTNDGRTNVEHNTFSFETYPSGWLPLDLETGIHRMYKDIILQKSINFA